MSGVRVGARVRDISGHSELLGLSEPGEGVIVTPTEGWTVKWDNPIIGSLNWSDEQLELVQPDASSQAEIERLRTAMRHILPYLNWTIGEESPGHHPTMPSAVAAFRAALGSKE